MPPLPSEKRNKKEKRREESVEKRDRGFYVRTRVNA
jgi:hypothetical protein